MLAREVVGRERACGNETRGNAEAVEASVLPDLGDEDDASHGERQCRPDTPSHGLVPDEHGPERDEHRRRELEQQADPDRETLDRDEVQPLDEREADDPVEDEERHLVAAHPEPRGSDDDEDRGEAEARAGGAQLRQPQARDARRREDHLHHRAVDREQRRRGDEHGVPDAWMAASTLDACPREDDLGHSRKLATGPVRSELATRNSCQARSRVPFGHVFVPDTNHRSSIRVGACRSR